MTFAYALKIGLALGLIYILGHHCTTTNRHVEVLTRKHSPAENLFEVSSPLVIKGENRSRIEKHLFNVKPHSLLRGKSLHARISRYNHYGQDLILHYADLSGENKAVILIGADDAISQQLKTLADQLSQPGSEFLFEGAILELNTVKWDNQDGIDSPTKKGRSFNTYPETLESREIELNDPQFSGKTYSRFLVTRVQGQN